MANSRSTRGTVNAQEAVKQLTLRERLLFAQVVYELGANDWGEISQLLARHPLVERPKDFFTPQFSQGIYETMMSENGLDFSTEDLEAPKAPANLTLAQIYYKERVAEIKAQILTTEATFKSILQDIDDIQAGRTEPEVEEEAAPPPPEEKKKKGKTAATSSHLRRSTRAGTRTSEPPAPAIGEETPDDATAMQVVEEEPLLEPEEPAEQEGTKTMEEDDMAKEEEVVEEDRAASSKETPELEEDVPEQPTAAETPAGVPQNEIPEEAPVEEPTPVDEDVDMKDAAPEQEVEEKPEVAEPITEPVESPVPDSAVEVEATPEAEVVEEQKPERRMTRRQTVSRNKSKSVGSVAAEPAPEKNEKSEKKRARESVDLTETNVVAEVNRSPKRPKIKGIIPQTPATNISSAAAKRFQTVINPLYTQIHAHRFGTVFQNPIKETDAPDYFDIVKRPIDLKTIKGKMKDGSIKDSLEFQRDVYLMYANAVMYNRPASGGVGQMAEQMLTDTEKDIQNHRATESFRPA